MGYRGMIVGMAFSAVLAACALFAVSCGSDRIPPPSVDGGRAFELAKEVVEIGPKPSGSESARKTVEFIAGKLRSLGLDVVVDEWREITPNGMTTFRNVVADIPGRSGGKYIVVGCHYDTKRLLMTPDFVGANDGASGVGLLIAMAEAIQASGVKPPLPLKLAFFDGEECLDSYSEHDGLHGSKRLCVELSKAGGGLEKCRAMILLDMVGDKDLSVTIPGNSDRKLVDALLSAARARGTERYFERTDRGVLDDHVPFHKRGVPSLDIIDFNFGPGNRYWHTGEDTLDKISPESLRIVGDAALGLIWSVRP